MNDSSTPNRRDLLKIAAAAVAGTTLSLPSVTRAQGDKRKPITIAGYKFDRTAALADGSVTVAGFDHRFEECGIGGANTHVFSGPATREV
ncbi:MAG: twin-arginine translocation signal domain-containing protein, partial [Verrucomicrobiales bacterium]